MWKFAASFTTKCFFVQFQWSCNRVISRRIESEDLGGRHVSKARCTDDPVNLNEYLVLWSWLSKFVSENTNGTFVRHEGTPAFSIWVCFLCLFNRFNRPEYHMDLLKAAMRGNNACNQSKWRRDRQTVYWMRLLHWLLLCAWGWCWQ